MSPPAPGPASDLVAQYRALRQGVGAYARPRDVLQVAGPQAFEYLQGQLTQDLAPLETGASVDSLLLAPDGKLVAALRVTRTAPDAFVLDCDGGTGEAVTARLGRFKLRSKFDMAPLPWSCVAVRGAGSPDLLASEAERAAPGGAETLVVPVSVGGWDGFDLLGPAPTVPDGVVWCGREAWDACRIEVGIPEMGAELDERTIAAEAHLVERTVSFTKGCYTGQELVARLDSRGSKVARRLCGLVPVPGVGGVDPSALVGVSLLGPDGAKQVGRITSAAWCPGLGGPAALGYVHRSVEIGEQVTLQVDGAPTGSDRAEVRALPMV